MSGPLLGMVGLVIGGQQLGMRAPLWLRLVFVTIVVVGEACMIPGSAHGFDYFIVLNWCYVIGVPIGLLFRSWKRGEKFLSHRHADWLVLAAASIVMKECFRLQPQELLSIVPPRCRIPLTREPIGKRVPAASSQSTLSTSSGRLGSCCNAGRLSTSRAHRS